MKIEDLEQVLGSPPEEETPASRPKRLTIDALEQAMQETPAQGPEPRAGALTTLGHDMTPRPDAGEAFQAGGLRFDANLQYMQGMFKDMVGLDPTDDIENATSLMAQADSVDRGSLSFRDVLDGGSFTSWASTTLAGLGPDIISTAASTAAGGAAGFLLGGPVGAAAGGAQANSWRVAAQSALRMQFREAMQATAKGAATAEQRRVATNAMRSMLANRLATTGAVAASGPQAYGEAYGESVDAGNPSPWGAFAVGTAMTGMDVLPVKYSIDAVTDVLSAERKAGGGPMTEAAKAWGKATLGESFTELGQEELLIRFRDALVPEDYAGSQEAWDRRLEAGAAGGLAGNVRGAVIDAPARAIGARREEDPPAADGTARPGTRSGPQGPGPTFRDRASDFASRFDPETDERGFVQPRSYSEDPLETPADVEAARQTRDGSDPGVDVNAGGYAAADQMQQGPAYEDVDQSVNIGERREADQETDQRTRDTVDMELRRRLRQLGYVPRDIRVMEPGLANQLVDNQVPVDRFREEMARVQSGGIISESQRDIDAQFNAMLDPDSPKRGMEVPDGSPMPSAIRQMDETPEGSPLPDDAPSDVRRVKTARGTFFTRDPDLAREVEQGGGDEATMARALGYEAPATQIDPRNLEMAVVRDQEGNVIHSEAVDRRKRRGTDRRLSSLGTVEYQSLNEQLSERMGRRAQDDSDAVSEGPRDMWNREGRWEGPVEPANRRPRGTEGVPDPASEPPTTAEVPPRATGPGYDVTTDAQRSAMAQQQKRRNTPDMTTGRDLANQQRGEAYPPRQQEPPSPTEWEAEIARLAAEQQADEAGADAPVRVFEHGSSTRQIRRDGMAETVEGEVFGTRQEIPRRGRQQVQDQGRMSQPQVDEVDAVETPNVGAEELLSGYQTRGGDDDAPTTIGVRVTPQQIDDANIVYKERRNERGRQTVDRTAGQAPVQHLAPMTIGPRTETATLPTESGDVTVPARLARDLRKYRQQLSQDTWEIATRTNEDAETEFMIVRRRNPETTSYIDRRTGERVTFTDDSIQQGDTSRSRTVSQRVMEGLERARWRGRRGEPPEGSAWRKMRIRDEKTGTVMWVNPEPLKAAGADANRGGTNDRNRMARGLMTALAVLDTMGYRTVALDSWDLPLNRFTPRVIGIQLADGSMATSPDAQALLKYIQNIPRSYTEARRWQGKKPYPQDELKAAESRRRKAAFEEARRHLVTMDGTLPDAMQQARSRDLLLPEGIRQRMEAEGVSLLLADDVAWATNGARDLWDTMTEAERRDVIEQEGLDPELTESALDEQPNGVIEVMNRLADEEMFVPAGDLAGDPNRRWEGAPRFFDEVPDTTDRVDLLDPARTRPGIIPDTGHGTRVHPAFQGDLGEVVRGIATTAKRIIGGKRNAVVVPWSNSQFAIDDIIASLPEADARRLMTSAQMQADLRGMLNGRAGTYATTMHIGSSSIVVLDPSLSPEMASIAMAHEMGHIAYKDHLGNLLTDKKRFDKLYAQFRKDREAGLVKQYEGDERMAFEEWMADRFASWLHRRSRPNQAGVAQAGAFAALRDKLRGIFDGARKLINRLKRKGDIEIPERMKANRTADTFYDKMAEVEALRSRVHDLRGRARTGRRRFDPDLHNELDALNAQLARAEKDRDASLSTADVRRIKSRVNELRDKLRDQLRAEQGTGNARLTGLRAVADKLARFERETGQPTFPAFVESLQTDIKDAQQEAVTLGRETLAAELDAIQTRLRDLQDTFTRTGEPVPLSELVESMDRARANARRRDAQTAARAAQREQQRRRENQQAQGREAAGQVRQAAAQAQQRRGQQEAQQEAQQAQGREAAARIRQAADATRRRERIQHWTSEPVVPDTEGVPEQDLVDLTYLLGGSGGQPPGGGGRPPGAPPAGDAGEGPRRNPLAEAIGRHIDRYSQSESGARAARFANSNLGRFLRQGAKAYSTVLEAADTRMARISPRLAQLIWAGPGTRAGARARGSERGFKNRVESETAHWAHKLEQALPQDEGRAEQVMRLVQAEPSRDQLPPDALPLFDLMQEMGEYLEANIDGFQARKVYGTRVYNQEEIIRRPQEFVQFLVDRIDGLSVREAEDIRMNITLQDGAVAIETRDQMGAGPGLNARHARILNDISNADLQTHGFLAKPKDAFHQHVRSAVHRAEFEGTFGGQLTGQQMLDDIAYRRSRGMRIPESVDRGIQDRMDEAQSLGLPEPTFYDPAARAKAIMNELPPKQRDEAFGMFEAAMGRNNRFLGMQITPKVTQIQSALAAYTWVTTLGLAAISQVTDLMTIAMRYRSYSAISDMTKVLATMSAAERRAFAEAASTVQTQATMDAIANTYGSDYMSPGVRKFTDAFFKITGLQAATDFNRALATQMGRLFIEREAAAARRGDQTATRRLADIGLDPDVVATWIDEGYDFSSEAGTRVRQALFDFVDESMLRPHSQMRPEWASNPWYQLLWILKPFMWGGKKIFLDGAAREFAQMRREGRSVAESTVPLQMIAIMGLPLAFLSVVMKDMAKEALNTVADDDEYEWMLTTTDWSSVGGAMSLLDRTGAMGPMSLAWGMAEAGEFENSPLAVAAGPLAERAFRVTQGRGAEVLGDSVPIAGLIY